MKLHGAPAARRFLAGFFGLDGAEHAADAVQGRINEPYIGSPEV
jgi:hypothetical protein